MINKFKNRTFFSAILLQIVILFQIIVASFQFSYLEIFSRGNIAEGKDNFFIISGLAYIFFFVFLGLYMYFATYWLILVNQKYQNDIGKNQISNSKLAFIWFMPFYNFFVIPNLFKNIYQYIYKINNPNIIDDYDLKSFDIKILIWQLCFMLYTSIVFIYSLGLIIINFNDDEDKFLHLHNLNYLRITMLVLLFVIVLLNHQIISQINHEFLYKKEKDDSLLVELS